MNHLSTSVGHLDIFAEVGWVKTRKVTCVTNRGMSVETRKCGIRARFRRRPAQAELSKRHICKKAHYLTSSCSCIWYLSVNQISPTVVEWSKCCRYIWPVSSRPMLCRRMTFVRHRGVFRLTQISRWNTHPFRTSPVRPSNVLIAGRPIQRFPQSTRDDPLSMVRYRLSTCERFRPNTRIGMAIRP